MKKGGIEQRRWRIPLVNLAMFALVIATMPSECCLYVVDMLNP